MRRLLILLLVCAGTALPYLKSMEVQPAHHGLSGWTSKEGANNWVGTTFIASFDSAAEVDLFVGDVGNTGNRYNVDIYEYPDAITRVAYRHDVAAPKSFVWLQFPMTPDIGQKIVRGKEYIVKVTRPNDSINWYKDTTDAYAYGHMEGGGGTNSPHDDLCMRLLGKARVGTEFATQSNVAWKDDPAYDTIPYTGLDTCDSCIRREAEIGIKYDKIGYGFWPIIQRTETRWVWGWLDTLMMSYADRGIRPIMSFREAPGWATCAYSNTGVPNDGAIPRNLWEPVLYAGCINPQNYYAQYVYEFVRRYGPEGYDFNRNPSGTFWRDHGNYDTMYIRYYEGFPETPLCGMGTIRKDSILQRGGYWRLNAYPNSDDSLVDPAYRETLAHYIQLRGDEEEGRKSSLAAAYARLIIVVDSAVKLACMRSQQSDPERPLSVAYIGDDGKYGMNNWLTRLK